jgi:hypothetical protein
MLAKYLGEFDDCFSRSEPAKNLRLYVNGQPSDLPRNSIEPMADRAGVPPRTLQQFLSLAAGDDLLMADRLAEIVAHNVLDPDEVKYFISNAPAGTPLEVLLAVAFQRYHVERCFEEEKGELGMDHFEVRHWRSLRRHLILTAVSHLFLAKVHQKWRGKKSGPDGLPTPPGGRGAGAFAVADRPGAYELPAAGSRDPQRDPATQREVPAQPCENPQAAVARTRHQTGVVTLFLGTPYSATAVRYTSRTCSAVWLR